MLTKICFSAPPLFFIFLSNFVLFDTRSVALLQANKNSLPHLAFYLYNTIVINALVRSDAGIYAFCEECETMKLLENMLNILQGVFVGLINPSSSFSLSISGASCWLTDPATLSHLFFSSSHHPSRRVEDRSSDRLRDS